MPEISLSDSRGRDAAVYAESVRVPVRVRWVDESGRQAGTARILKGTVDRDYAALLEAAATPDRLADLLVAGDPEVDVEAAGGFLRDTSRVYVNTDRQVVHAVSQVEVVRNPDGTEKLRRPKKVAVPNVSADHPLLWGGKLLPKGEVYNKFAMVSKLQVVHVNGLTYDFLYGIAKELEAKNSLLVLGAGPKANQPLVLRRGAVPYRGFLEGRTRGADYLLLLHLSNIELKAPEAPTAEAKQS
ncbi:MAG TPA: hypothetical protein VH092_09345 [Urbifossiella sp.]|jgi:hypothetical protein|nr:hypothetical protein [Urbifossiella sp.]